MFISLKMLFTQAMNSTFNSQMCLKMMSARMRHDSSHINSLEKAVLFYMV